MLLLLLALGLTLRPCVAGMPAKPSILLILADDMGYGELGCYGQEKIRTPHLDRMAAEGMRFTRFYAGCTVCAPSRSVLMTGLHTGHTPVRGNAGKGNVAAQTLPAGTVTVPGLLKTAGFRTGLIGKWGLGDAPDGPGHPLKQGFGSFFGYLDQTHAHNHYPDFLWRDSTRVPLKNDLVAMGNEGAGYSKNRVEYSDDLFAAEAEKFIRDGDRSRPFFLFLSLVVPHANNERNRALGVGTEVPDFGPYAEEPWSEAHKGQAASITRMDGYVGRLRDVLRETGQDRNTLILFSSDNGPHAEGGNQPRFFNASGGFRGIKRELTEGGIRVPLIACLPGGIAPGQTSGHVGYFGDLLATAADLSGVAVPPEHDSLSLVPVLGGTANSVERPWLYWEFHEGGTSQAVLMDGRWKAIRLKRRDAALQIYDVTQDPGEIRDLAADRPDIAARAEEILKTARTENPHWPLSDGPVAGK
ncbi:MAG: sulfatase [Verrucomicrobiales bacterium]|nr:sulfatase [Verrucomicrobiales bacterium]